MRTSPADQTVRELADRIGIQAAIDSYALGIDRRDADRFLSAWHPDAVFDSEMPAQLCHGHNDLRAWLDTVWKDFTVTNHFTMNHSVTFDDADTASGLGHACAMFVMADGSYVSGGAFYHDRYERRDDVWRMAHRRLEINHFAVHPDAQVTVSPGAITAFNA